MVYGTFRPFGAHVPTTIWYKPHQLPWESIPVDHNWGQSEPQETLPGVFAAMEAQVDAALRSQGKPGLQRNQKGRGTIEAPMTIRHPITPVKPSRRGEVEVSYLGESFVHTKWVRQLRRIQSLCKLLRKPITNPSNWQHVMQLWNSIRGAPGFPGGFPKAWLQRAHVLPDAPMHLPKKPPTPAQAEAIFLGFQLEFKTLEQTLTSQRRAAARTRRVEDPNVVFKDVAKPRSMPVQSVVTKVTTKVSQVSEDGLTIHYEPPNMDPNQEIESANGWLHTSSHEPGVLVLETEAALEEGDQLTQSTMHGGVKQIFQAFEDLWRPM